MNTKRMTALFMAVMVVFLTACGSKPGYPVSDDTAGGDAYMDGDVYAGGDAYYEEEPESEWGPVDVQPEPVPDYSESQPEFTTEPVENDIHIRVEGDTLYFSGVGTVRSEDYGSYDPVNVVIEDGITGIGNSAFEKCRNLQSVILPDSLRIIGSFAFYECTQLTSIVLPDGVESIERDTFAGCTWLTSVVLPSGLKEIQQEAFTGCISLDSIDLPNSLQSIGASAFRACESLTAVTIPGSVDSLPGGYIDGAFQGCSSLTSVTICDGVRTIGRCTFANSGLTSVTIPDSVETIETEAFIDCRNLAEVTFGGGITSIDSNLADCPLTRVKAPNSIQELIIKSGIDLSIVEWY